MSKILLLALVVIGLTSCKKDKAEFVPTTVENTIDKFAYKNNDPNGSANWFSATNMKFMSLPDISKDNSLHENIIMGYYFDGQDHAIYSPDNFPKTYGQENWGTRRSVVFRKSHYSFMQLSELYEQYQGNFPVNVITEAWQKGINQNTRITHPQEGEAWLFRTTDGKITGLLYVRGLAMPSTQMEVEIWVAK